VLAKAGGKDATKMDPQVSPSSMKLLPSNDQNNVYQSSLKGLKAGGTLEPVSLSLAQHEIRVPSNMFVTTFIGDVFDLFVCRGDAHARSDTVDRSGKPGSLPENQKKRPVSHSSS